MRYLSPTQKTVNFGISLFLLLVFTFFVIPSLTGFVFSGAQIPSSELQESYVTKFPSKILPRSTMVPSITRSHRIVVPDLADSQQPIQLWNRSYGSDIVEICFEIIECESGGFAFVGGNWNSTANTLEALFFRADNNGVITTEKTYAMRDGMEFWSIIECSEGGFAMAGTVFNDTTSDSDAILLRTDALGNTLWNQTYDYHQDDWVTAFTRSSNGDFVLGGCTGSYVGSGWDLWLIRTAANGNHQWNKTYVGPNDEFSGMCKSLVECTNGDLAFVGQTRLGFGDNDAILIRTDSNGNYLWNQTYGGSSMDEANGISKVGTGGFVITGQTLSFATTSEADMWLICTDEAGNSLWNQTYGSPDIEYGACVIECSETGFAIIGQTSDPGVINSGDIFFVRTDSAGVELWNFTFSGPNEDLGTSVVECSDGGFLLFGSNSTSPVFDEDILLVRLSGPPRWIEQPTDQFAEKGSMFAYDLNVTAYPSIGSWWLNDSSRFTISNIGVVQNATILDIDRYGLQVWVNNSVGDIQSANFSITVEDTTPPVWVSMLVNHIIEYQMGGLDYQLEAEDLSGIHQWWINDTTHFEIDGTGRVYSADPLPVGIYGIAVQVYDPYNNRLDGTFRVTVQDTTPPDVSSIPDNLTLFHHDEIILNVFDYSGIHHWALNDSVHFSITAENKLTVIPTTPVGTYGLNVTAYDPYDNAASTVLSVTVKEQPLLPPPIPGFPFATIILGTILALLVGLVRRRKIKGT